ncbi:MAG: MBL fold metallo-hydrolase [Clostridia bacterium]|nr:MBL fold metallo-hydrolase [Clostridia bacterium]
MLIKLIENQYPMMANCWLIYDEKSNEAAIVDTCAFDDKINTKKEIEALGCRVKYVLLTHGHFDHILGTYGIQQKYGAAVVCHKGDAAMLADAQLNLARINGAEDVFNPVKPDITVDDGDSIYLGDTEIKVIHTPGHTKGSVCYVIEDEKTVFSGDTLFCRTVGRTDFPGGSTEELKESLKKLLALEGNYRVLPGHNRETDLESERTRNIFIRRM